LNDVGVRLVIVVEKLKVLPLSKGVVGVVGGLEVTVPHVPEIVTPTVPAWAEATASMPNAREKRIFILISLRLCEFSSSLQETDDAFRGLLARRQDFCGFSTQGQASSKL
jgi:hypothetical protein